MSRIRRIAPRLLTLVLVVYGGVVVVFSLIQRTLLYFPTHRQADEDRAIAAGLRLEPVPSRHGDLLGFRARHPDGAEATLIVAHGNAGTALDRDYFVELARGQAIRFDVLLVEYPGYGSRRAEPNEGSNVEAVVEAIDVARRDGHPIVVLGESLGSAVVSLAAAERRNDVSALILVTPLPRMSLVAHHHYPFIPTFLIADRYEADTALERFGRPVAFVVARHDEVIPAPLGLAMHAGYSGPKTLEIDEHATHNSVDYDPEAPRWRRVFGFVADATAASASRSGR